MKWLIRKFNGCSIHSFCHNWRVVGKNDCNSQGNYVCYYQRLNLNQFPDVDIIQWSQEYWKQSSVDLLEGRSWRHWCLIIFWLEGICTMIVWSMIYVSKDLCSRKMWCQVQILSDHFWKCWLHEYLLSSTLLSKWTVQKEQININDLVLIN